MTNLAGLHDIESVAIAPPDTWVLDTLALSESPPPRNYTQIAPGLHVIARLNWGYGSSGTLPLPTQYHTYVKAVVAYVAMSRGCHIWVVGNEPNLAREWPDGQPIFPWQYAECYKWTRQAIHALPGHETDEVLIAAPGPWNDKLKYPGNEKGDWIKYFQDVNEACDGDVDGFSLHAYTHGYDVALVTSTATMNAPFHNRHYNFRTYQDFLLAIPDELAHLPSYITEANGDGPWQAVGLMPAMLAEIDAWNKANKLRRVRAVIFYRYPHFDENAKYAIAGKPDVIAEYLAAVGRGYQSPPAMGAALMNNQTSLPFVPNQSPTPAPDLPPRDLDPRAAQRGTHIIDGRHLQPGQQFWRVRRLYTPDEAESDLLGPDRHVLANVLVDGQRQIGVPLRVAWGGGNDHERATIVTKHNPNFEFSADHALTPGDFTIYVAEGKPSEIVRGIKMGMMTPEGWNPGAHTSTLVDFELTTMPAVTKPAPPAPVEQPEPTPTPVPTPAATRLIWPTNARRSQRWGENPAYYQGKLGIPYHNGVDHAAAQGTAVVAMAEGEVMFVGDDPGYGIYCRLFHASLGIHSFVAHLSRVTVTVGQRVKQGDVIAFSGATGLTATTIHADGTADTSRPAPHTHTEIRVGGRNAYAEGTFGHNNGRIDPEAAMYLINHIIGGDGGGGAAAQLDTVDPLVAEALLVVESNGAGFEDGELKIRVEAHILERYINNSTLFDRHFRYNRANPLQAWYRVNESSPWVAYHNEGQTGEWGAFAVAVTLNRTATLLSTSMGAPQIMGFHHADIGYSTPQAMFEAFERSVIPQIIGFFNLCIHKQLIDAMHRKDWAEIVRRYNGTGLEAIYVPRLITAYKALGGT